VLTSADEIWGEVLGRLFYAFPGGLPGIALLLLRAVFGIALLMEGRCYVGELDPTPVAWLVGLGTLASGVLLLIGFLTPIVGAIVGTGAVGIAVSVLPTCTPTVFESGPALVFGSAILGTIIALGPGAFSVDARVFGRREIIIPGFPL
jgi:uncharacterized membrane protein YphA (DoxX/SURF4 family)